MLGNNRMRQLVRKFDGLIIAHLRKVEGPFARLAIFVVYFWFGVLKLVGTSPATALVHSLFERTISFISFPVFYTLFSIFEIAIGLIFLLRGYERIAIFLLFLHICMTALPLVLLPNATWQGFLSPTLEGQYIIKNILIAAAAIAIGSKLVPYKGR